MVVSNLHLVYEAQSTFPGSRWSDQQRARIHTWKVEDTELLLDVAQALRKAQDAGFALIVITNQSGIGLGMYGHDDVAKVHAYLEAELSVAGVHLTDIFYCPHHPEQGKCLCRKPGSLLLERAIARHGLQLEGSAMIGDGIATCKQPKQREFVVFLYLQMGSCFLLC
ncbi:MAG: HAD-IIIA family hydrolase [Flavobacteriales bacterium]|nr:HAD-IIIA family hydrolase [Flavobacteriales bacterium]